MSSPQLAKKHTLRRSISRAANSFFHGNANKSTSTYWTQNEQHQEATVEDLEDQPYWIQEKKLKDETIQDLEASNEYELQDVNETPELQPQKVYEDALEEDNIVNIEDLNVSNHVGHVDTRSVQSDSPNFRRKARGRGRHIEKMIDNTGSTKGKIPKPHIKRLSRPYFIITVSTVNVVLFIWSLVLGKGFTSPKDNPMLGPSLNTLVEMGAKWVPSMLHNGEWWRLFTATYLHSGIIHLVLNLVVQVKVGWDLEREHGTFRIFPIYILSGLSGNLLSSLLLPAQVTVGASGAIYGFLGVLIVDLLKNWKKLPSPCRTYVFLCVGNIISLALGLFPGLDNFAHIGGFVMGIVAGVVFLPSMHFGSWSLKTRLIQVLIAIPILVGILLAMFIPLFHNVDGSEICGWCKYFNCLPIFTVCK